MKFLSYKKLLYNWKSQSWVGPDVSFGLYISFLEFWRCGISYFPGLWSWGYRWPTPPANDRNSKLRQCFKAFSHFYICFIPTSRLALVCHKLGGKMTAQRRTLLWREKNVDGRERRLVIRKDTPELVIFLRLDNNNFLLLLWFLIFKCENIGVRICSFPRGPTWPFWLWLAHLAGSAERPNLITEQRRGRRRLEKCKLDPKQRRTAKQIFGCEISNSQLVTSYHGFSAVQNLSLARWLVFQETIFYCEIIVDLHQL